MRLNSRHAGERGASALELLLLVPFAVLSVVLAAEANRYFEARLLVTAAVRGALLPDRGAPAAVADTISSLLSPIGQLNLTIDDIAIDIDGETGAATGFAVMESAIVGSTTPSPFALQRAVELFAADRPHPFASRASSAPNAPFEQRATARFVALSLALHNSRAPLLHRVLTGRLQIAVNQLLPLRAGGRR